MRAHRGFQQIEAYFDGRAVHLVSIGAVAQALGRSSETVRRMEAAGILPPAQVRLQKAGGQRLRLYAVSYVEALAELPEVAELRHRRRRPAEPELAAAARAARRAAVDHCTDQQAGTCA